MYSKLVEFKGSFFATGQDSDTVKGVKYQIFVSEGTVDFIHGGGHNITEIYIPC